MNTPKRTPSLLLAVLFLTCVVRADVVVVTSDVTISAGDPAWEGQDLEVHGATVKLAGSVRLNSLSLIYGAVLTEAPAPSLPGVSLTVSSNMLIASDARVDLSGKGAGRMEPPKGASSLYTNDGVRFMVGTGGSHGGQGGRSAAGVPGGVPINSVKWVGGSSGSSGGNGGPIDGPAQPGGAGGGMILLRIGGKLVVDGSILADGFAAANEGAGGGAGGGILIDARELAGTGVISANGGDGDLPWGGGGGGGRIKMDTATNAFTGAINARGGAGSGFGGAGTIWLGNKNDASDSIVMADNGGQRGEQSGLMGAFMTKLSLRGGASATIEGMSGLRSLLVGSNSSLLFTASGSMPPKFSVSGDVVVEQGGTITADGVVLLRSVTSLTSGATQGSGSGGANCGYGGQSTNRTGAGSALSLHSGVGGGGRGAGFGLQSPPLVGGGAIEFVIAGSLRLDGTITARGTPGAGRGGGGGAGGAIAIEAGALAGSGLFDASGGDGELPDAGGGGGGMVMLSVGTNLFTGTARALGGQGFCAGGAGVVAVRTTSVDPSRYQVLVDGEGQCRTNTFLGLPGTNDIVVTGGAVVELNQKGDFHTLLIRSNSWVTFARVGASPSTYAHGRISATVIMIEPNAGVRMDGFGSQSVGIPSPWGDASGNGAAHAGSGGYISGFGLGRTYGRADSPTEPGNHPQANVAAGGGAVEIAASERLTLDGVISASGLDAPANSLVGGGAGGGVVVRAMTLAGKGWIKANGGAGATGLSGGGGGGRVGIYCEEDLFAGRTTSTGGTGLARGGAGTILKSIGSTVPTVFVSNEGASGGSTALGEVLAPYDLIVSDEGIAQIPASPVRNLVVKEHASLLAHNMYAGAMQVENLRVEAGASLLANGSIGGSLTGSSGNGGRTDEALGAISGGGGGSGGDGGRSSGGAPGGPAFNSPESPRLAGGGGGRGSILAEFALGGMPLLFQVKNRAEINGTIEANGAEGRNGGGGGAGGNILIQAETLTGTGSIKANGGAGTPSLGGGGGGGRIALVAKTNTFAGSLQALGGPGVERGGAGTIFLESNGTGATPHVVIDNGGHRGALTPLTLAGEWNVSIAGAARVRPVTALEVASLQLKAGAAVEQSSVRISASGDLLLDETSSIEAVGVGFGPNLGPGAGAYETSGSGGGHGATGGASASGLTGGKPYGNAVQPNAFGSGGGAPETSSPGSSGGGAIWLTAGGSIIIDGLVSADGGDALVDRAGGGSGGSIYIAGASLRGTGRISAEGGDGYGNQGGGGAGGRIALCGAGAEMIANVSTVAGAGAQKGEDGSIVRLAAPLSSWLANTQGKWSLKWNVPAGLQCRIHTSTNLVDWSLVESPPREGDGELSVPVEALTASRFFRIEWFPAL